MVAEGWRPGRRAASPPRALRSPQPQRLRPQAVALLPRLARVVAAGVIAEGDEDDYESEYERK